MVVEKMEFSEVGQRKLPERSSNPKFTQGLYNSPSRWYKLDTDEPKRRADIEAGSLLPGGRLGFNHLKTVMKGMEEGRKQNFREIRL